MHKGKKYVTTSTASVAVSMHLAVFLHICKKCKKSGHGEGSCETQSKIVPSEVTNSSEKSKKVG